MQYCFVNVHHRPSLSLLNRRQDKLRFKEQLLAMIARIDAILLLERTKNSGVRQNGRVGWYPQTQDERKECIRRVNGNCENKGWKGFPFPPRGKIQNAVVLFILVHISCFLPGWKPLSCLPPVHFKQDDSRSLSSPPLRFFITIYSRAPLERAVAPIFCG